MSANTDIFNTRSEVLREIQDAEREVRFAAHELQLAKDRVYQLVTIGLRNAVCDHPDSTGFRCDHCGEFADYGTHFWNDRDTYMVRVTDVHESEFSREYYHWLIRRSPALGGYPESGTLPLLAYYNS